MTPEQRAAADRLAKYWSADDWPGGLSGKKMDETAALLRELAAEPVQEPLFWVRLRSDGGYEGPIAHSAIEEVRRQSGAWTPLYAAPQQRTQLSDSDLLKLARRCLWLAYVWNDHNFSDRPHKYAQDEAKALGINSFEDAKVWLVATHAAITGEPT